MQLEDKIVDDREAALAEGQHREDVEDRGEEVMPEVETEALHDAGLDLRSQLLGAIRMVLDGRTLSIGSLRLPQREAHALEALQVATEGKSADLGSFVYAEDRRDLLEQALAVLQPNLTRADEATARELHVQFADLAERVGELRAQLGQLEDAQDELETHHLPTTKTAADPTDTADKPKPVSDPDAPRPASTLAGPGPEAPPLTTPPSTLVGPGPEAPPLTTPPSTLAGPGPEASHAPSPTTLVGPDLPAPRPTPSTLSGPDAPGSPDDAKTPKSWWRKPFG